MTADEDSVQFHDTDDELVTDEFAPSLQAPGRVRALLRTRLRELQFGEDLIERPLGSPFALVGRVPHGLGLVAALAIRWGVTPGKAGKTVWAEIPQ